MAGSLEAAVPEADAVLDVSEPEAVVHAAGGVVVWDDGRRARIALVHRPRYDDWSLPKGKLDGGETHEAAALREVLEETGLKAVLGSELSSVEYTDRRGRRKIVRYWRMAATPGEFIANDEVDELRWVPTSDALELLTYRHDRELVRSLGAIP